MRPRQDRRSTTHRPAALLACLTAAAISAPASAQSPPPPAAQPPASQHPAPSPTDPAPKLSPFSQDIPSAAFKFDMLPIPGSPDGKIKPFWIGKTELQWEALDVFVYRLDEEQGLPGIDAVTHPSKPYIPPDRGFGHEGYAAISVSFKNATEFCKWLSARSGRTYRLPTEAEWEWACRAGDTADDPFGGDVAKVHESAWFAGNSNDKTQPVGKKKPNAWGLHDMLGNVAEWATVPDDKPVVKGGSYRDRMESLKATSRAPWAPAWQSRDPQIPKSPWWLSDGPFVGFRVVCEWTPDPGDERKPKNAEAPADPVPQPPKQSK